MPEELPNLRDVGGVAAAGGTVRHGRLLRSAQPEPGDLVPDRVAWPPLCFVDLRSQSERREPHPLVRFGAREVHLPLLSALRPDRGWAADLPELYLRVLEDAPHLLVEAVEAIATTDGPVLVHCAAGKDRTGVVVALVLRLLGVSRDDVVTDYLLTDQAREAIDRRLRRDRGHSGLAPAFFETPVVAIDGVMDVWDAADGGTDGWFLGAGGSESTLTDLRASMIDPI